MYEPARPRQDGRRTFRHHWCWKRDGPRIAACRYAWGKRASSALRVPPRHVFIPLTCISRPCTSCWCDNGICNSKYAHNPFHLAVVVVMRTTSPHDERGQHTRKLLGICNAARAMSILIFCACASANTARTLTGYAMSSSWNAFRGPAPTAGVTYSFQITPTIPIITPWTCCNGVTEPAQKDEPPLLFTLD